MEPDLEHLNWDSPQLNSSNFIVPSVTTYSSYYHNYHLWTTDQTEYLCGMGAGIGSVFVTFPINKIMFRQSLWGFNAMDAIRQLSIEGTVSLFRGCLPPILIKSFNSSVMFGTFNQYRHWLQEHPDLGQWMRQKQMSCTFVAAMMGGSTEAMLTPFERVQMILQDDRMNAQYRNTMDALFRLRRYGLSEYYRGMTSVLLRNGPATFLYFGFKDPLKQLLLPSNGQLMSAFAASRRKEAVRNFISGALLGCAISTLFYPLNVIRIQMMTQEVGSVHLTVLQTAAMLYEERAGKAKLLLSGIHANAARSFLYWGCMTVFSELLRDYFLERS